ncbi:coiled-coil protein, partial [Lasius niger]
MQALVAKAEESGDPLSMEAKIRGLTSELVEAKKEALRWKNENEDLRNELKLLHSDVRVLKLEIRKIKELSMENEKLRTEVTDA